MPIDASSPLPRVAGLDVGRGLRLFAGQVEAYREALDDFIQLYGSGLGHVAAYLAEPSSEHLQLARREVHGAGGAGAALGATEIERLAQQFEAAIRQPQGRASAEAHLVSLQRELAALVDGLNARREGA